MAEPLTNDEQGAGRYARADAWPADPPGRDEYEDPSDRRCLDCGEPVAEGLPHRPWCNWRERTANVQLPVSDADFMR